MHSDIAGTDGDGDEDPADPERDRQSDCASHFAAAYGLTQAEAEIAAALAHGERAPAIAAARGITTNTLQTLRRRAYSKLGVSDQIDLISSLHDLWPASCRR